MSDCPKCIGGYWRGLRAYRCFTCNGTGVAKTRARRKAEAESTGLMLQTDALPSLQVVQAFRAAAAAKVRPCLPGCTCVCASCVAKRAPVMVREIPRLALVGQAFRDDSTVQRSEVGGRARTYEEVFGKD